MSAVVSCPVISVIVAVHNVRAQVAEAISSLRAQDFHDFEALVIDDGSSDGSGEVAIAAFAGDPRFRLIRQENRGLSGARNRGLEGARGEFIAFLDGDDAYAPTFLSRLHGAIQTEGTDWAACALTLLFADGAEVAHPALHAAQGVPLATRLVLSDARAAAAVFPSAWNKLYRRAALGDLRFFEGSWFEDHEFYWAAAARCPVLAYVGEPLYRHRRERAGQITGTDSERVFEQFAVLERLRGQIARAGFDHADEGFVRLASRLVHERAMVTLNRARRERFIAAAAAHFDAWGMAYAPDWDPTLSLGLGLAMRRVLPLSVVVLVLPGEAEALQQTLRALERQSMADFDLHVIAPAELPVPERLGCGLAVTRLVPGGTTWRDLWLRLTGASVALYRAGECPLPDGLLWLVNAIERTGADLAFGRFNRGGGGHHDGWCDNRVVGAQLAALPDTGGLVSLTPAQALRIYPVLGNRVLRKGLAAAAGARGDLAMDDGAVQGFVLATALAAGRVAYTRLPVAEVLQRSPEVVSLRRLAAWARALPAPATMPRGWRGVLFVRRALPGTPAGTPVRYWLCALFQAWRARMLRADGGAMPDPATPLWVGRIWHLCRYR